MLMDRAYLARELYNMEIIPPLPSKDVRWTWLNFTHELDVAGGALETFVDDLEAAVTIRDRLIAWARIWSCRHPIPYWRPWYEAIAGAGERGDWDGVGMLCQMLVAEEQGREEEP
jgi:hypothetical protein